MSARPYLTADLLLRCVDLQAQVHNLLNEKSISGGSGKFHEKLAGLERTMRDYTIEFEIIRMAYVAALEAEGANVSEAAKEFQLP